MKTRYHIITCLSILSILSFFGKLVAQSSGIASQEFTSFEPAGGNQLVDLKTGDFTYNIPIIHVPGPGGGYDLPLFYHAGIKAEQNASWVGLGWNINPGAITRIPLVIPDDVKNHRIISYSYKDLGNEDTESLSFGSSYKAINYGGSVDWGTNQSATPSINLGVFGAGGINIRFGDKISAQGTGVFSRPTFNMPGMYSHTTKKKSIPQIGYVKRNTAYYFNDGKVELNFGTLYTNNSYNTSTTCNAQVPDNDFLMKNMDIYENPYNESTYDNPEKYNNNNNLAFPAYDNFMVSAQGIAGNFSPNTLQYESLLFSPITSDYYNRTGAWYALNGNVPQQTLRSYNDFPIDNNKRINFRFNGEPVSYHVVPNGNWDFSSIDFDFTGCEKATINLNSGTVNHGPTNSFNTNTNQMYSANPIVYFTNEEIVNTNPNILYNKGYIATSDISNVQRSNQNILAGVGAFTITNAEGYSYYFSLPVYSWEKFSFNEALGANNGNEYQVEYETQPYAVHWLLTGITGPDFVDKGSIGMLDNEDEGYWVKFDYGQWANGYIWDTEPQTDPNTSLTQYSVGRKEIYYLDAIETKTHIAYFVKNIREDAQGRSGTLSKTFRAISNRELTTSDPITCNTLVAGNIQTSNWAVSLDQAFSITASESQKLLQLDKVIIVDKESPSPVQGSNPILAQVNGNISIENSYVNFLRPHIPLGNGSTPCNSPTQNGVSLENNPSVLNSHAFFQHYYFPGASFQAHLSGNVWDANDNWTGVLSNALSVIEFSYDYSLAQNSKSGSWATPVNSGRLTLKKVKIHGLSDQKISPSYDFTYHSTLNYIPNLIDDWGYRNIISNTEERVNSSDFIGKSFKDVTIPNWSLKSIFSPIGGLTEITYESDEYEREAIWGNIVDTTGFFPIYLDSDPNSAHNGELYIDNNDFTTTETIGYSDVLNSGDNFDVEVGYTSEYKTHSYSYSSNTGTRRYIGIPQSVGPAIAGRFIIKASKAYGGGLRVKQIEVKDNPNNPSANYTTKYTYEKGVTSYSFRNYKRFIPYIYEVMGPGVMYEWTTVESFGDNIQDITDKSNIKTKYHFDVISNGSYVGHNFSMGEYFKVQDESGANIAGDYTNDYLVDEEESPINNELSITSLSVRKSRIINRLSRAGRILEIQNINKLSQVIESRATYDYFEQPDNLSTDGVYQAGYFEESYNQHKKFKRMVYGQNLNDVISYTNNNCYTTVSRSYHPFKLSEIITEVDGIKNIITYSKFDTYTGIPLLSEKSGNSYNDVIANETEFATNQYSSFKSKTLNYSYKNILTAPLKVTTKNDFQTMSVGVATYTNNWKYRERDANGLYHTITSNGTNQWRSDASYSWKGLVEKNGSLGNVANFSFNSPPQISSNPNQGWERVSEPTLYDRASHVLEARGMNNRFVSTKYGYGKYMRTLASVANARYTEFAYSGAEDVLDGSWAEFGGEVGTGVPATNIYTAASPIDAYTHTGYHSIRLETNQWGLGYSGTIGDISNINNLTDAFQEGKTYRASVWVRAENGVQLNSWFKLNATVTNSSNQVLHTYTTDVTTTTTFKAGDWYLLNLDIPLSQYPNAYKVSIGTCNLNASMPVYVDDFRVHPLDAPLKSYVYDKVGRVIAVLDNDNIASRFTYDAASNVIKSEQETKDGFRVISQEQMHFARPLE